MIHQTLIWLLIIGIVIFQIYIFKKTYDKIVSYKNILNKPEKFHIHKVYVDADEIEHIDSEHIINNLNYYKQNPNLRDMIQDNDFDDELVVENEQNEEEDYEY
jgi:hypothetical protein